MADLECERHLDLSTVLWLGHVNSCIHTLSDVQQISSEYKVRKTKLFQVTPHEQTDEGEETILNLHNTVIDSISSN